MATNYKITYKNHCTPQEYITENSRWYLDSDIGARLTGTSVVDLSTTQPTYATGSLTDVQTVALDGGSTLKFMYVKNTGASGAGGINIAMGQYDSGGAQADGYRIYLAPGECFASEVRGFTNFIIKSLATTTYEYIKAT